MIPVPAPAPCQFCEREQRGTPQRTARDDGFVRSPSPELCPRPVSGEPRAAAGVQGSDEVAAGGRHRIRHPELPCVMRAHGIPDDAESRGNARLSLALPLLSRVRGDLRAWPPTLSSPKPASSRWASQSHTRTRCSRAGTNRRCVAPSRRSQSRRRS